MFIDINGGGPEFYFQVLYFIPSFSAVFAVYLIICGASELF